MASVDLKKITIGQLSGSPSNEKLIGQIFDGTKYKVVYEPNMGDYLLCHAAFVIPAAFACYKTDGNLKKLKKDNAYLNRLIDANIEGYRAIKNAGHEILPQADKDFESAAYRKTCFRFFKLMCRHLGMELAGMRRFGAYGVLYDLIKYPDPVKEGAEE